MRMFTTIAAVAAATVAGAAAAVAADLPSRRPPAPAVYAPAPVFTWSGLYLGVNGGGWFLTTPPPTTVSARASWGGGGGLVGGTIGYNFQAAPTSSSASRPTSTTVPRRT